MRSVFFRAAGHKNIVGKHETTLEITTESNLTKRGSCIIGTRANQTLRDLDADIKALARNRHTRITLRMMVDDLVEELVGRGSPGLLYSDNTSMVARMSSYECGRTVLVDANKAASDLNRILVERLRNPIAILECELVYVNE